MSFEKESEIPLLCGKPSDKSIFDPMDWVEQLGRIEQLEILKLPAYCILSFPYMKAVERVLSCYETKRLEYLGKEAPIYTFEHKGMPVCFAQIGVGAPMAGSILEKMIALGVEYIVFFGGAGVLNSELKRWTFLVPAKAIRDEGTSYHYQKPSRYSHPSPRLLKAIKRTLKEEKVEFVEGAVWTTDAPFRETVQKRRKFLGEGAVCVDMEASALFSIAKFRRRQVAALFYAGDYVGEDRWDLRMRENHQQKLGEVTGKLLDISLKALHETWCEDIDRRVR